MFSIRVINSAKFLKMPIEAQCLYFHLVINADDGGDVEAYAVMRITGANQDHLNILEAKGFIKVYNTDFVSNITHWKEHKGEI